MEPLFSQESKRGIKDTLQILYSLAQRIAVKHILRESTLSRVTVMAVTQMLEFIIAMAHDMRFDAVEGTVVFMQKDETCVSKSKLMGCGKGKRAHRDGSSWYHTLVNCDQVLDTTGEVHYPMKEIFVRYLERTDAATMTAHVRHAAKNYRTQIRIYGRCRSKQVPK